MKNNPYKILGIAKNATEKEIDEAYSHTNMCGDFTLSYKILKDQKYRTLYDKYQDYNLLVKAGFFVDNLKIEDYNFDLDFLITPFGKILNNLKHNNKKNIVLLSTGGFAPLHSGHIHNMEMAKSYLEKMGYNVVGGYFSPCHEDYVRTKPYYNSNLFERLYECNKVVKNSDWLMIDSFECLCQSTYTNFTFTLNRLQQYLNKHISQKVEVAYVFGADNAEFMYCFENDGIGICLNRSGNNKIFEKVKNELQGDRCIFIENQGKESELSSRQFRQLQTTKTENDFNFTTNVYAIRNEGLLPFENHLKYIDQEKLKELQKEFLNNLCQLFNFAFENKIKIKVFDTYSQLENANKILKDKKTISIDNFFVGTYCVGISRLFDISEFQSKSLQLVERPGLESIKNQISKIKPGQYILVDDDIATGSTIKTLKSNLPSDITIKEIYLLAKMNNDDFFDIVDLRDFIVGVNQSGLVVKLPNNQIARAPYLFPYVNLSTRACVPYKNCINLSLKIWELNKQFYSHLPNIKLCDTDFGFQTLMKYIGFNNQSKIIEIIDWHIKKIKKILGEN